MTQLQHPKLIPQLVIVAILSAIISVIDAKCDLENFINFSHSTKHTKAPTCIITCSVFENYYM
jgi:hypothetical protein